MQIMTINEFANKCGYFYNAALDPEAPCAPNNGYNCRHPQQEKNIMAWAAAFSGHVHLQFRQMKKTAKNTAAIMKKEFVLVEEAEVAAVAERNND